MSAHLRKSEAVWLLDVSECLHWESPRCWEYWASLEAKNQTQMCVSVKCVRRPNFFSPSFSFWNKKKVFQPVCLSVWRGRVWKRIKSFEFYWCWKYINKSYNSTGGKFVSDVVLVPQWCYKSPGSECCTNTHCTHCCCLKEFVSGETPFDRGRVCVCVCDYREMQSKIEAALQKEWEDWRWII